MVWGLRSEYLKMRKRSRYDYLLTKQLHNKLTNSEYIELCDILREGE